MRANKSSLLLLAAGLSGTLANLSVRADFSGPYVLTPVAGSSYGAWTAAVGPAGGWIDVTLAPAQLTLAVPSPSLYASGLRFTARAETTGVVSFTALAVTRDNGGYIEWASQRFGTNVTRQVLDQAPPGMPQLFAFPVEAGDTFGFTLSCGSDALPPGTPPRISLLITNFTAPGIPPMLLLGGGAQSNGQFCFSFTNYPGSPWRVLAGTNLAQPRSNWAVLNGLVETSPGQFQFTDADAPNYPQRFYFLSKP